MDFVVEVDKMPVIGETILGNDVTLVPGGKGANQAYALGKLGGNVQMIGAVGDDVYGRMLIDNLKSVGVGTSGIAALKKAPTGNAFITVDALGDNMITVIPGANLKITKETIDEYRDLIELSDIIIMQLEIPLEVVSYTKDIAKVYGKTIILDPAPAVSNLPEEFWNGITYIKPNETELGILTGKEMSSVEELKEGARELLNKGVKGVIVTMGANGCLWVTKEQEIHYTANKVKTVDTTAAGDSFTAGFALGLSQGKKIEDAIQFGQKVSSIVVTRKGAQTSIPTIEEVEGM